jgi:pimeloyl-ACP methyl ester carboxylesterase
MTWPALVLVHGGAHAGDCWDLTVDELHRLAPDLDVLAVDLPGRRGKPGDLRTLTVGECVDSVVADIDDAGLAEIVIVAHSMGGLTVPGVVTKLGSARVREMVLATAFIPPEGGAVVDTIAGPLASMARRGAKRGVPGEMNPIAARLAFLNGVRRERRRFMLDRLCADTPHFPSRTSLGATRPTKYRGRGSSRHVTAHCPSGRSAEASRRWVACRPSSRWTPATT